MSFYCSFARCQQPSDDAAADSAAASSESKSSESAGSESAQPKFDHVWYGPAIPPTPETWEPLPAYLYIGTVQELDSEKFIITLPDGNTRSLTSDRVIAVAPAWRTPAAAEGAALLAAGKFRECIPVLQPALGNDLPRWQQRLVLTNLIKAAAALDAISTAGKLSLTMVDESPPAMLLASLPLAWTESNIDRMTDEAARAWIDDSRPAIRLLGASWLVNSDHREKSRNVLQQLQNEPDRTVAQLAATQLWRFETTSATQIEPILQWQLRRDKMALPLQLGPTLLIADRLSRAQQTDLAIAEHQRIVTLHSDRYDRVLAAQKEVKRLLAVAGRTADLEKYTAATKRE